MKKILTLCLILTMSLGAFAPVAAGSSGTVTTQLEVKGGGGGDEEHDPIILASWVARKNKWADDSTAPYSQIIPSGEHEVHTVISVCSIVTDPDGLADIENVYADFWYPEDVALGDHHTNLPNQSGDGCGMHMQQDHMSRLGKTQGYDLFCDHIRNKNDNLPEWEDAEGYGEICGEEGVLQKETAAIWCVEKEISYEDPSGYYRVTTNARDGHGPGTTHIYGFEYLGVTAFEIDFETVDYGTVKENVQKIIAGDLNFDVNGDRATVRNVGNTRLQMGVEQDDMGLSHTSGVYNVQYKARIGSSAPWTYYQPTRGDYPLSEDAWSPLAWIEHELDLSETNEMDFGITVTKFPDHYTTYSGEMILSAQASDHLLCEYLD